MTTPIPPEATLDELPVFWRKAIRKAREDCGRFRTERNVAIVERDEARAALVAVVTNQAGEVNGAELAELKDRVRRWRSSTGEGFGLGSYDGADSDFRLLMDGSDQASLKAEMGR